ncbi:MAG: DUF2809 domain-containing protein [Proteobacteria bacterium]|nr:DUF2809 domain-containing protein [Pseudomonadota bacterium]
MIIDKTRTQYIILTIILLLTEILIALFVHDTIIRPHIGDVLVVILIYCFVRCFIPKGIKLLPLYVFIFAVCVEVMQYFKIIDILELRDNKLARIIIGSTFDWGDIAAYATGCVIIYVLAWVRRQLSRRRMR